MRYKIVIILIALILLNGLNNARELNQMAIVLAIGIDKVEDNEFLVTAFITNPQKQDSGSSSGEEKSTVLYKSKGNTIQNALRKIILESPKPLYLAHMKLLLISEEVAKDGLENSIDFFIRNYETNNGYNFVIVKNAQTQEVLELESPIEDTVVENITRSIEFTARDLGICNNNTLNDTLKKVIEGKEEVTIPSITVRNEKNNDNNNEQSAQKGTMNKESEDQVSSDNENKGSSSEKNISDLKIIVDSMAYFKDNKLQGYLTQQESMMCNILNNDSKKIILEVNGEENFVAEFISISSKKEARVENGEYFVDIEVNGVCNITEIKRDSEYLNKNNVEIYKKEIEDTLENQINEYIKKCQNLYKTDILGYENLYMKKLNKEYKSISDIFSDEIFSKIKSDVSVNVKIPNDGGIYKKW